MTLKAILFDFNGVIINDELIHQELIQEMLLSENLRPKEGEYREICLGKSDRICIQELLASRGRIVSPEYLDKLILAKSQAYQRRLSQLENLPIYPELQDFLDKIQVKGLLSAIVTGALRAEVDLILRRAGLQSYFELIVAGDDIKTSKPAPDGYLLAVKRLNQRYSDLHLRPVDCLVIEDTPAGIQAAKAAGMQVVGVANTYPFHMLQRQANWSVDYLRELELDRVTQVFARVKV
jgi:beta-phosphoglucomutase